jgi:hypothetical protein
MRSPGWPVLVIALLLGVVTEGMVVHAKEKVRTEEVKVVQSAVP